MALTVTTRVAGIGRRVAVALLLAAALPEAALSQPAGVAPEARQLLKASTDFLARQPRFSLDTESSIEVVLASGQKLQFDHTARVSVERPNKLRAERTGDLVDQVFYYDGESLTLHNPEGNYYATIAAPGSLEEMLDFAREKLDVVAPASDLLYKNALRHPAAGRGVGLRGRQGRGGSCALRPSRLPRAARRLAALDRRG